MDEVPDPETRLLSEREQGRGPRERVEPVPRALEPHLRDWLAVFLHARLERRVASRLGLELTPRDRIPSSVSPPRELARHPALQDALLLDAIDLALQWDDALNDQLGLPRDLVSDDEGVPHSRYGRLHELSDLDELLDDGGSTYQAWAPPEESTAKLIRRVDPTMQASADRGGAVTDVNASRLLRRGWSKAFSRDLDPDGAYHDAVRAVEVLACPLVLPNSTRRTLHAVALHLRDDDQRSDPSRRKWELVLTKFGDGTVEPLAAMFDRLWHGNLASRHGDDEFTYREVTLAEARAGVQLAVTLVQWLSDDVLRRRDTTNPP